MWLPFRSLVGRDSMRPLGGESGYDTQKLSQSKERKGGVTKQLLILVLAAGACSGTILAMFAWSGASL
jgi:hypothetical protein